MSDNVYGAKLRLVALDMDGTALKSDGQVSPGTIEALKEWIKEGGLVVPASGRTYGWIPEEILGLGVPYVISGNGASVIDTEKRVLACGRRFPDFCILRTGWMCLEFNRKGTSKGEALKYLCHSIGIKQEQVMAIGDSENDVEMLACAGIGVAMGNAPAEVKKAADIVTKTNDEEGVTWILRRVLRRS